MHKGICIPGKTSSEGYHHYPPLPPQALRFVSLGKSQLSLRFLWIPTEFQNLLLFPVLEFPSAISTFSVI